MYSKERKIRSLAVAALAVAALLALPRGAPAAQPCEPAGTPYEAGVNCRFVEHDGVDRRYVVHVLRWPATGSAVLRFGMVSGMRHRYPDQLVPEFWRFFRSHPLTAAERGRA